MNRLSVVDDMFLRSHRGLGTPIAMQGLWRFTDTVDRTVLGAVHRRLTLGPLARRVVRSRIPGARPRWVVAPESYPLTYDGRPVVDALGWADAQPSNLDPSRGPGWRLSATDLVDGSTVVSIVCSHVLTDARGLILAVDRALHDSPPSPPITPGSDWRDAARTWSRVVAQLRPRTIPRRDPIPHRGVRSAATTSAVLDVAAEQWDDAARRTGGSANSLFVALVTGILRASGAVASKARIDVAVPIGTRRDCYVGNAMTMTEVAVGPDDTPADIRARARRAYLQPMSAPTGIPDELLQIVPDRIADVMARGSGERDVLCSNIGEIPPSFDALAGARSTGVATRAVHPDLTVRQLDRLRTRLSGYLCRSGSRVTLSLVGLDPDHIVSDTLVADLALNELGRWGLTAQQW